MGGVASSLCTAHFDYSPNQSILHPYTIPLITPHAGQNGEKSSLLFPLLHSMTVPLDERHTSAILSLHILHASADQGLGYRPSWTIPGLHRHNANIMGRGWAHEAQPKQCATRTWWDVPRAVGSTGVHGEEPRVVPLLDDQEGDGRHVSLLNFQARSPDLRRRRWANSRR